MSASNEDWSGALSFALGMGIAPEQFWRLSVKEWRMLTGSAAALGRDELAALLARFPDGQIPPPPLRGTSPVNDGGGKDLGDQA